MSEVKEEKKTMEKRRVFKTNYSHVIASSMLFRKFYKKTVYVYLKDDKIVYSLSKPESLPVANIKGVVSIGTKVCFEKKLATKVNKTSLLIVLPKPFLEKLGIKVGDIVNVVLFKSGNGFVIFK